MQPLPYCGVRQDWCHHNEPRPPRSVACRAQVVRWSQALDYHPAHGRWERLQVVHCASCSWEPPVLGWEAREAAVEAYCGALPSAARERSAAAGSAPARPDRSSSDGLKAMQRALRQPGSAAVQAAVLPSVQRSSPDEHAAQRAMPRDTAGGDSSAARTAQTLVSPQQLVQADGTAAAATVQVLQQTRPPAGLGFEGLSLCLFKRVPRGETAFRRN